MRKRAEADQPDRCLECILTILVGVVIQLCFTVMIFSIGRTLLHCIGDRRLTVSRAPASRSATLTSMPHVSMVSATMNAQLHCCGMQQLHITNSVSATFVEIVHVQMAFLRN